MHSVEHPRNLLLQALPAAEFEALRPRLELVQLVKDTVLVEAGAPITHVYPPHSGVISLMVRLSEGQSVEVAMVGRDSVFGASAALDGGISLADAIVVLPGTAAMLSVADFRAAAERSAALRGLVARHEQALFAQAQQSVACNASHTVEARFSRWLLRVRDLSDSETWPLTQEFLAQMIGVQRNAVSIVAHALQKAGMIRYSRGHIEIKNVDRLLDTACECYRAVKAKRDRLLSPPD
jgi:CRP-like cAMP-binding protein